MNRFSKLSLAAVALSSCAFAANTATQTFTQGQTNESFSINFAFAKFDPTLGTLTSIHFTIAGSDTGSATITNGNTKSGTYTYTNQSDLYVTSVGGGLVYDETLPTSTQTAVIASGGTKNFTGVTASSSSDVEYDGNYSTSTTFPLGSNTGNGTPTSPIDASAFVGTGTVSLTFNGDNTSGCNGPSVACTTSGTGGGTVSLYYDYTPATPTGTPEPATMGLFGSALVGLGFVKFRRRKV